MFGKTSQGDLNGFLDAGSHIQGELRFEDTFRVDGRAFGPAPFDGFEDFGLGFTCDQRLNFRNLWNRGDLSFTLFTFQRTQIRNFD